MTLPDKVKRIIAAYLPAGNVGVAVSGGSDSMCLLDCLLRFGIIEKNRLIVVNVDHGIRGKESERDSAFVAEYCAADGLTFIGEKADIPALSAKSGRSPETEARLFRRELFASLVASGKCSAVLLAHNACDRTESVLMHAFRGCGLKGLAGMRERDGYIIRPLLGCDKDEILDYVRENGVEYVEDSTNADDAYDRNFLRLDVLPLIRSRYPGLDGAIARLSDAAAVSLSEESCRVITESGTAVLPVEDLRGNEIIAAFNAAGLETDYTGRHTELVKNLVRAETGSGIDLPHGFRAERESNRIRVFKKSMPEDAESPFSIGAIKLGERYVTAEKCESVPRKDATVFDSDKLPAGAVVRPRRRGDRFMPYGGAEKSLSDWLIDKKIPRYERDRLFYIAAGSEVFVVIGIATGERVKIDDKTKNAVLVTVGVTER